MSQRSVLVFVLDNIVRQKRTTNCEWYVVAEMSMCHSLTHSLTSVVAFHHIPISCLLSKRIVDFPCHKRVCTEQKKKGLFYANR